MYSDISYFLLDVRANQSGRAWVPWSIDSFEKYSTFVYFTCIISSHIRIYLLFSFGCSANRPDRAWVPWSIDSFENTLSSCTLHLISSHVLRYLLFSFGCSGEPVQSCVSSLKYRFLWKIQHIRVLYMHNIISYTHISVIFLWMFGRTGPTMREFPGGIDSFENTLSSCTLHLISCHVLRYLLFSFGCSGEPVRSCVSSLKYDSFEKYSTFVYFTCIISSHIRIYLLFSFGCSANWPDRAWVPWSIDSFENTLSSCTLHLISSHILRYLLFSFGCSGEPVQSCVSSLKYRFLWKIQHIRVLYMHNIISYAYICYFLMDVRANRPDRAWVPWSIDSFENTLSSCTLHLISSHVHIYLLFSFGCSGEPVQSCVSSLEV